MSKKGWVGDWPFRNSNFFTKTRDIGQRGLIHPANLKREGKVLRIWKWKGRGRRWLEKDESKSSSCWNGRETLFRFLLERERRETLAVAALQISHSSVLVAYFTRAVAVELWEAESRSESFNRVFTRGREGEKLCGKMPCLNLSTNVSLDGLDTSSILSEASKTVAKLIGKPEAYVMVVLKGSIPMSFGGTQQPAAFGELVSIGGLNPDVNKKLSAAISAVLEDKLSVPKNRFFLKFYDSKGSDFGWNGSTF